MIRFIFISVISVIFFSCNYPVENSNAMEKKYPLEKSESQWLKELGSERYYILRQKGTEPPHSGKYNLFFESGDYHCGGCGQKLFSSVNKFESNCGWPSFDQALPGSIIYQKDTSFNMIRTEILCSQCGGHLGHVFDDGPTNTGQRYCVNSLSIDFTKD